MTNDSLLRALVRLARPHQWVKNGFVLVGLLFGHRWGDAALVGRVALSFVAFSLASSAVYVTNDILDREVDRRHPEKRKRPIASGLVRPGLAAVVGCILAAAALALAAKVSLTAVAIIACYAVINLVYSLGAKNVVILDVFIIAAGFMLRILAGTIGVGIEPSRWLLLCGLMVTLFLGFAKRRAEGLALADGAPQHRRTLEDYDPAFLDNMISVCAAGVLVTYSLYTVDPGTIALHRTDKLIYTVPFVLYGLFRYLFLLHRCGGAGDPSSDLLRDPHLAATAVGWLAMVVLLLF
ncbi:MAG: decaprenyl-phosphate phosphoribosyltransferase [Burkholderiales bacterium]